MEAPLEFLSWRMDPAQSYSDWKVVIFIRNQDGNSERVSTHNVHKAILSFGPKQSLYFKRLFQDTGLPEHKKSTSRITFDNDLAADAFPLFLDYLYPSENELDVTYENVAALNHFGEYFGVADLRREIEIFCQERMTIEHCGTVFLHAKIFHDEELMQLVV